MRYKRNFLRCTHKWNIYKDSDYLRKCNDELRQGISPLFFIIDAHRVTLFEATQVLYHTILHFFSLSSDGAALLQ